MYHHFCDFVNLYLMMHLNNSLGSLDRSNSFKDVVFSLLFRMVFGMYYNMPLIADCEGSGVFQAFIQYMLHELQVPDNFQ